MYTPFILFYNNCDKSELHAFGTSFYYIYEYLGVWSDLVWYDTLQTRLVPYVG